ncbi:MAG: hypothetical protein FWD83_00075 [Promicromonosporaceae bacterium]|nr:hypothetical protein [Promicromonosporaceae bacterium]
MPSIVRSGVIGAIAFAVTLGGMAAAQALWQHGQTTVVAPLPIGNVAFGVSTGVLTDSAETTTYERTTTVASAEDITRGVPLYVRVPGEVIAQVMNQRPPVFPDETTDELVEWVTWRFAVYGRADGFYGMNYDVEPVSQVLRGTDETVRSLADGIGSYQTLLGHSTMVVFPAAENGECTAVPGVPGGQNVHSIATPASPSTDMELIPNVSSTTTSRHAWCVGVRFNSILDGEYIAEAIASGLGLDGRMHRDFDQWRAIVAFPPAIPPVGTYGARGTAEGIGEDGAISRDHDEWYAPVAPNPDNEPDVILRITPQVLIP